MIDVGSGIYKDREKSRYNQNIRVTGNTFRLFDRPLLLNAYCVDGLEWKDNIIEDTDDYPAIRNNQDYCRIEHCDRCDIGPLTIKKQMP